MDPRLLIVIVALVGVPTVLFGYIVLAEQVLRLLPHRWQGRLRPWVWIAPAIAFVAVFLVGPTVITIVRSFQNRAGDAFVGLTNYLWFFGNSTTLGALKNNALWLVLLTTLCLGMGLLIAVLVDRVRYESLAKVVIFIPLAISMTAASVIWRFMFDYQPAQEAQTGTLNALVGNFGAGPFPWLTISEASFNSIVLILVMTWMWTGFGMVIISASLKGINAELLEAARVDGAGEWQVFRGIILPLLAPTLAVVATTMIITGLKAFDIVYVMTNGDFDTEVIANRMYKEMFLFGNFGRASAIAVILLVLIVPIMAVNIRRFRTQEAIG